MDTTLSQSSFLSLSACLFETNAIFQFNASTHTHTETKQSRFTTWKSRIISRLLCKNIILQSIFCHLYPPWIHDVCTQITILYNHVKADTNRSNTCISVYGINSINTIIATITTDRLSIESVKTNDVKKSKNHATNLMSTRKHFPTCNWLHPSRQNVMPHCFFQHIIISRFLVREQKREITTIQTNSNGYFTSCVFFSSPHFFFFWVLSREWLLFFLHLQMGRLPLFSIERKCFAWCFTTYKNTHTKQSNAYQFPAFHMHEHESVFCLCFFFFVVVCVSS